MLTKQLKHPEKKESVKWVYTVFLGDALSSS